MESLREFYGQIILEECSNFPGESDNLRNNMETTYPQLYNEEQFNYGAYIALIDTKESIVGTIGIEPNQVDKTVCTLNVLAVEKDSRNCGFGRILLEFAIELSKQLRFKTIIF